MKIETKKATDYETSALTDETQLLLNDTNIISNQNDECKENILKTLSLNQIYDTVFQPKTQILEGMLQTGAYLFVGAPKIGKSFLMAQIGHNVSKGVPLWGYKTYQGTVLYLALEDDYPRIQKRLSTMFHYEDNDNFHFAILAPNMSEGLESQLENFVLEHEDTKLIMIDTLQKVREKGNDNYSYANDTEVISRIKLFAEKHNLCVLLVHHTRKAKSDDPFENISGTNGLLGAVDGAFIIAKKERSNTLATIDIDGRDFSSKRLNVSFDKANCIWNLDSVDNGMDEPAADPLCVKISVLLTEENPSWQGTSSELITKLELENIPANVLTRKLNVSVDELLNNHKITLRYKRTHADRLIILERRSQA